MAQRRLRLDDDDFLAALDEFDAGAGLDATVCRNLPQTGSTPIARRRSRHVGRIAIAVAGFLRFQILDRAVPLRNACVPAHLTARRFLSHGVARLVFLSPARRVARDAHDVRHGEITVADGRCHVPRGPGSVRRAAAVQTDAGRRAALDLRAGASAAPVARWLVAIRVAGFTLMAALGAAWAALLFQEQIDLLLR
ncbi:MAG TPA: hypothetical protein VFA27_15225 [Vicinamibacterales bacterium]|nr:hypothetical protein [Vicinamibacterales bacterium]